MEAPDPFLGRSGQPKSHEGLEGQVRVFMERGRKKVSQKVGGRGPTWLEAKPRLDQRGKHKVRGSPGAVMGLVHRLGKAVTEWQAYLPTAVPEGASLARSMCHSATQHT